MDTMIMILQNAVPSLISLLSVFVAAYAVVSNKKIAERQALFAKKAQVYDDFLRAFSALAYDCDDPKNRDALTNALYRACIYAQKGLQRELGYFADMALAARDKTDFVRVEKYMQDIIDGFWADLHGRKIKKNSPLNILIEELECEKAARAGNSR